VTPALGPSFFCAQVDVNHGIRYAQWVLRALSRDAKIVCVRLDPTERKLSALFDNLDKHQQTFLFSQ
jgi:hypothetical protein